MAKATLRQIAEQIGVDHGTVSRVLNNKHQGRISPALAERIRAVATSLNYRPNLSARCMRSGQFGAIALLASTINGMTYLPSAIQDGICDELEPTGFHLTFAKVAPTTIESPAMLPKMLRTEMADGLLLNCTHKLPDELLEAVAVDALPVVWMNAPRKVDAVYPDHYGSAVEMTRRLIGLGHRRIAMLDIYSSAEEVAGLHFSELERAKGYRDTMREAGLTPMEIRPEKGRVPRDGEEVFHAKWLGRNDRPTAVFCHWFAAVPGILTMAARMGIRVPEDLSIGTVGGHHMRLAGVRISAMIEPEYEMGRRAARMVLQRLEGAAEISAERLQFEFVEVPVPTIGRVNGN